MKIYTHKVCNPKMGPVGGAILDMCIPPYKSKLDSVIPITEYEWIIIFSEEVEEDNKEVWN